ncbi:MAG: putative toxin-antitoxin system toxin component, PIN family [Dehalococcoidales bacterium]|nr:putative toxin-antitoxin system toxin component, PIN family [Dehalococcoidales bacterium]
MASKPKPRVFLDSNVIFSGLYSSQGAPGTIVERFIKSDIHVVVSPQVLEEVIRTIKEKIPSILPALRRLLVSAPPEVVTSPELTEIERWRGRLSVADAAILAAAVAAQPDYFITGDNHFLENPDIGEEAGLRIMTPAQFLKSIEREEA